MAITLGSSAANPLQNTFNSAIGGVNRPSAVSLVLEIAPPYPLSPWTLLPSSARHPQTPGLALTDLNSKLPTLNDLRTALANLICTPFNSLKGEITSTFTTSSRLSTRLSPLCQRFEPSSSAIMSTPLSSTTLAARWFTLLRPQHSESSLLLHWSMHLSNGNDSADFRGRPTRYANSGRTPQLLEQLPFPLSNSPTRSFSHSMLSSSRPSARAQLASLPGFSGCSCKPETWSHGLYPPALMCLLIGTVGIAATLIQFAHPTRSSSLLRACLRTRKVSPLAISHKYRERNNQCHRVSTAPRTQRSSASDRE